MGRSSSGLALAGALGLALMGCADEPAGSARRQITQGSEDNGDPAVVALLENGQVYCTGTLIAGQVVLTAGHCVDGRALAGLQVYFGAAPGGGGRAVAVAAALVHPDFAMATLENDLALLLLAESPAVTPAPMLATPFDPSLVGARLRVVGFGLTGPNDTAAPRKREGDTVIDRYDDQHFVFRPNPAQTCRGDSGGPGFVSIGGVEYLAGVASSGDPTCSVSGTNTRVDAYLGSFIKPALDATAAGAADLGQRCFSDGNCASGQCVAANEDPELRYCTKACGSPDNCSLAPGMDCALSGTCRYDAPTPGARGTRCAADLECVTGLCAREHAGDPGTCVERCASTCATGLRCLKAAGRGAKACFESGASGGCSVAPAGGGGRRGRPLLAAPALLGLVLLVGFARAAGRTRRQSCSTVASAPAGTSSTRTGPW